MSRINFITGELNGRLGEIVGSRHRGTYYTKTFVPPANPDSPNQHGLRSAFSHITKMGSLLYQGVLKPYLYPKHPKGMEINILVKNNQGMIRAHTWNPIQFRIGFGGLPGGRDVLFTRAATTFRVTWQDDIGQDINDDGIFIVYDETTNQVAHKREMRGDMSSEITMQISDFTKVYGYLFFSQTNPDGKTGSCSITYAFKFT